MRLPCGTFTDITDSAFGDDVNLRSASSIACADVDGDGWLDIYVGNLITEDSFSFDQASHPGHYNVLYLNNGDLTFRETADSAGVRGPEVTMRDSLGRTLLFEDPEMGEIYEGYDPTARDASGNRIGDPTGRTHAVLFLDYDDDGDPDLWVANDGDRLHVFRNESSPGEVRFTPVARAMGIDKVGNWMGFAVGDYDGDADLDLFVTNLGYHPFTRPIWEEPGGDCAYHGRFAWGQCANSLLRNDGTRGSPALDLLNLFEDVAQSTVVVPSVLMPPDSLDPNNILDPWEVPTGLAAYDFGYGATFLDFDNDGDQDLYWLGSEIDRGLGPFGHLFPSAGRMLRGDGQGSFEDITVRAHLLDIQDFDYSSLDPRDPGVPARLREFRIKLHENGKGLAHGDFNGDGYAQIPHLDKRRTSLAPATKGAKMFLDQEKRSPTRCSYYEARLTGIPVRAGEGLDRYDGTVRPDDVRGVDASSGFEVIGRAPRETAGERSGLDGQPDDHLADAAELGRRRVGVRP